MRREGIFRNDLCNALKGAFGAGVYIQKNFDPALKGTPDCEFILRGRSVWVELKAIEELPVREETLVVDFGTMPTAIQLETIYRVEAAGGNGRCIVLVHPLKLVIVRSAGFIKQTRFGFLPRPGCGFSARHLVRGFAGVYEWDCARTSGVVLESILFGSF